MFSNSIVAQTSYVMNPSLCRAVRHGRTIEIASVLALLAAGAILRLYHLSDELFYSDEAFSWRVATRPIDVMVRQVADDTHPLLHFFILRGWMAIASASPLVLRIPSIVAGVATIALVYLLCRTAIIDDASRTPGRHKAHWCAFLAGLYVTLHPLHIEFSRTARMNAFAALLSALSALLLLYALRSDRPARWRWWIAYAVAAALLLHTHNFGLFTVVAQAAFVAMILVRRSWGVLAPKALSAFGLIAMLYAPWLPFFLAQADRVQEGFWIPRLTVDFTANMFALYTLGSRTDGALGALVALLLITLMVVISVRRAGKSAWGLALQAAIPWVCAIAISILGDRSILQSRYLLPASVAFAAWLGVVAFHAPGTVRRVLLVCYALLPAAFAGATYVAKLPTRTPSIVECMTYLRYEWSDGDILLVGPPEYVNILRFYATQSGWNDLDVRCVKDRLAPPQSGQKNHEASLHSIEFLVIADSSEIDAHRVWVLNDAYDLSDEHWNEALSKTFPPTDRSFSDGLQFVLYERSYEEAQTNVNAVDDDSLGAGEHGRQQ